MVCGLQVSDVLGYLCSVDHHTAGVMASQLQGADLGPPTNLQGAIRPANCRGPLGIIVVGGEQGIVSSLCGSRNHGCQ